MPVCTEGVWYELVDWPDNFPLMYFFASSTTETCFVDSNGIGTDNPKNLKYAVPLTLMAIIPFDCNTDAAAGSRLLKVKCCKIGNCLVSPGLIVRSTLLFPCPTLIPLTDRSYDKSGMYTVNIP